MALSDEEKAFMDAFKEKLTNLVDAEVAAEGEALDDERLMKLSIAMAVVCLDEAVDLLYFATGDEDFVRRSVVQGADRSIQKCKAFELMLGSEAANG